MHVLLADLPIATHPHGMLRHLDLDRRQHFGHLSAHHILLHPDSGILEPRRRREMYGHKRTGIRELSFCNRTRRSASGSPPYMHSEAEHEALSQGCSSVDVLHRYFVSSSILVSWRI